MQIMKIRDNRGITIIALVVTIIVLLILAGITISAMSGDSSVINKSQEAKKEAEISKYQEQLDVIKHGEYYNEYTVDVKQFLENCADAIRNDEMFKKAQEVTVDEVNEVIIVVTEEGYRFEVTMDDVIYIGDGEGNTNVSINDVILNINADPRSWTNGKVNVKITSNISQVTRQYSTNNGSLWQIYNEPIEIEDNGTTIQARAINEENETTQVINYTVQNIDRLSPDVTIQKVTGVDKGIKVEANAQDKEATAKDGKSGIKGYQFSNDNGSTWTETKTSGTYTFSGLNPGENYQIKVKAIDNAGNESISQAVNGTPAISVPDATGKITFTQTPNNWTNDSIKVTLKGLEGYEIEYAINGENYQNYTGNGITMEQNGVIKARLKKDNETGNPATCIIDRIDKLNPYDFAPSINNVTTNSITVIGNTKDKEADDENGSSGIKGYQFSKDNGANWTEIQTNGTYTFTDLTAEQTYSIKIKAIDNAGNETDSSVQNISTNKIPNGDENIVIAKNPSTDWTKGPVKVTIQTGQEGYVLQYSYNNSTWETYQGELTIENNGQYIYARLFDGRTGGEAKQEQITNIDKLAPNDFTPQIQTTTSTITVIVNVTDRASTSTSGSSGIRGYKYSKDNGETWSNEIKNNTYTFTGLQQGQSCQIKVKAIDNAGNETDSSVVTGTTTEIPGANGNIKVGRSENQWTNKPVTITLSTVLSGYSIEYSINNTNSWKSYTQPIDVEDNNTVIYARLTDGKGGTGSYITETISNIDRLVPKSVNIQVKETTSNSITVRVSAEDADETLIDGKSGIVGYKFYIEGQGWSYEKSTEEYTFSNLKSNSQYQIKVIAVDDAGNEKESGIIYGNTTSMPDPSSTITITKTPDYPIWTNGTVKVTITTTASSEYTLQYSKNDKDWSSYINAINVTNNNEIIYARLYDQNSQDATESISAKVTNIDTLPPNKFTPQVSTKTSSITITANGVTDQPATSTSGSSGIRGYKFYIEGRNWTAEQTSNTYTFASLTPETSYEIKVKAIDNAGNEVESYATTGTTQSMPGGNSNILFSYNPSTWTKESVEVTITASTQEAKQYNLEYSLTGKDGWKPYTSKVVMTSNGPIYARLVDDEGNYGATATGNVGNIDKVPPEASYTLTPASSIADEVTININATDDLSGVGGTKLEENEGITMINSMQYKVTQNKTYNIIVYDNAGNQVTLEIPVNNVRQKTVEDLEVGDRVYYESQGQGTIECIVLYDKNYNETKGKNYGVQIIAKDTLESFDIDGEIPVRNPDDYAYNDAIIKLNEKAEEYLNSVYATDARSVGSVPDNKNSESGYYTRPDSWFSKYNNLYKTSDNNYLTDYNQMKLLGISQSDNIYWLASRAISNSENDTNFFMNYIQSDGTRDTNLIVHMNFYLYSKEIETANVRPVFTLRNNIKIISGDGETIPYKLGI